MNRFPHEYDPDDDPNATLPKQTATKLADLRIQEISGVDFPANDGMGGWLVLKQAAVEDLAQYADEIAHAPHDEEDSVSYDEPATADDAYGRRLDLAHERAQHTGEHEAVAFDHVVTKTVEGRQLHEAYRQLPAAAPAIQKAAPPEHVAVGRSIKDVGATMYPDLSRPKAVTEFVMTSDGAAVYAAYREA